MELNFIDLNTALDLIMEVLFPYLKSCLYLRMDFELAIGWDKIVKTIDFERNLHNLNLYLHSELYYFLLYLDVNNQKASSLSDILLHKLNC